MKSLPIPSFFDVNKVDKFWQVPYQKRSGEAKQWKENYKINSSVKDKIKIALLLIDVQNTFCLPDFELFVGGKSGNGAVEDSIRLCEFIYKNLANLTTIVATMDTHQAMQIFHPIFWVDENGNHPEAGITMISYEDVKQRRWNVNHNIAYNLNISPEELENYALHYVKKVTENSKYPLTIWPYHSMLGGIGHGLVSAVEEALFFHNMVRHSQTHFELKGDNALTENYSVLSPEVLEDNYGEKIAQKNTKFLNKILCFDKIIIAGQAKSHCVAWTVEDLLTEIKRKDTNLAKKVYLLEDCTSPVVIPGVIDFTEQANAAFQRFSDAGMHRVNSTDDIDNW